MKEIESTGEAIVSNVAGRTDPPSSTSSDRERERLNHPRNLTIQNTALLTQYRTWLRMFDK